jgi:hypothetical protein
VGVKVSVQRFIAPLVARNGRCIGRCRWRWNWGIGIKCTGLGNAGVMIDDSLSLLMLASIISAVHRLLEVVVISITGNVDAGHRSAKVALEVLPGHTFLAKEWAALGILACVPLA